MLMLFVLSCKTWNIVKPGAWLPDPLQGLNSLKIPHILPVVLEVFLLEVSRLKLTVRAVSMQVRSKVRGLLYCPVSETYFRDYLGLISVTLIYFTLYKRF